MIRCIPQACCFGALIALAGGLFAQEAQSGFDLRTTLTAEATYSHLSDDLANGAFRAVFYPTWKIDDHWVISGAVQLHSQPFFLTSCSKMHTAFARTC